MLSDGETSAAAKERFVRIAKRAGAFAWKWGKRLAIATGVVAIITAIVVWRVIVHYEAGLPSIADLKANYHPPQVTRVLARDGTLLAEIFTERRTVVSIHSRTTTRPPWAERAVA